MSYAIPILMASFIAILLMLYLKFKYSYWRRHGIPHLPPTFPFGSLKRLLLLRTSFGDFFRELYALPFFQNEPVIGFYILHTPALLIREPGLIRQLLIKEFRMFPNRYEAADAKHDHMGSLSLPLAKYAVWHESRKKISHLFTSAYLKEIMYPRLLKIAKNLDDFIARRLADGKATVIEVKEMCALYTTDTTTELIFSRNFQSLEHEDSELRRQCQELLHADVRKAVDFFFIFFLPSCTHIFRPKTFSKRYANYVQNLVAQAITSREGFKRPPRATDLIDILIKFQKDENLWRNAAHHHPVFIASQAAIFILAGFETSSSLMAFILFELCKHPRIQDRLRNELRSCFYEQTSASYSQMSQLPYLDMVIAEGLRLYPTAPFINRECINPHKAPGLIINSWTNFIIPDGMPAYVSILGLHRDPHYWPNPTLFNPERFSRENMKKIPPMVYLPFGAGPHGCIGSRLGLLQVKIGLGYILKKYRVESCLQTVTEIQFDPKSFMLQPKDGLYLKFVNDFD